MDNSTYPKEQIKSDLETIRNILINVSTGNTRIEDVDSSYTQLQGKVRKALKQMNIIYDNNFRSLWDWHSYYSGNKELTTYKERRTYIAILLNPTFDAIEDYDETVSFINKDSSKIKDIYNKYDVFVSHATADKIGFVEELVSELHKITQDVWYDKKMMKWGNSLKSNISEGLAKCEFGIIVI